MRKVVFLMAVAGMVFVSEAKAIVLFEHIGANDPTTEVTLHDINSFLDTHVSHIKACGDIETKQKHYRVDDRRHEDIKLIWEGNHNHPSGLPVIFSVTRVYRDGTGKDHWEDAYELVRRAIEEWKKFLESRALLK